MQYIVKVWHSVETKGERFIPRRNAGQIQCINAAQARMIAKAIDGMMHQDETTDIRTEAQVMVRMRLGFDGGSMVVRPNDLSHLAYTFTKAAEENFKADPKSRFEDDFVKFDDDESNS